MYTSLDNKNINVEWIILVQLMIYIKTVLY